MTTTEEAPVGTVDDLPLYTVLGNGYALIFQGGAGPCAVPLLRERAAIENLDANGVPYYETVDGALHGALQELL